MVVRHHYKVYRDRGEVMREHLEGPIAIAWVSKNRNNQPYPLKIGQEFETTNNEFNQAVRDPFKEKQDVQPNKN
jgi:hypothetical protein